LCAKNDREFQGFPNNLAEQFGRFPLPGPSLDPQILSRPGGIGGEISGLKRIKMAAGLRDLFPEVHDEKTLLKIEELVRPRVHSILTLPLFP